MLAHAKSSKVAEGEAVVLGDAKWTGRLAGIIAARQAGTNGAGTKGAQHRGKGMVFIRRLGLAGENGLKRQLPEPWDRRGMRVVAARDEGETGILHVGNKAVAQHVPADSEPYRREIILRIIEARGEVVDDIGQAVGLIGLLTKDSRGVAALARGRHFVACFKMPLSTFG